MSKSESCVQVAGYIRVSSARQANEGDSLPAQRAAIHREAERRQQNERWDRYEIEFYEDAGRSGKNQNRPELQRLRDDIEAGRVDEVIAYKLDRITRSISDFADLWDFFSRHDVNLFCIRDNFDTDAAMGRAMLHIVMVFAQLERELTGERTRATMLHRAEQGMWNHRPPYGYRIGEDGKLTIDLEFAQVIQKHFFDAAESLGSVGAVTRHVRQLGIQVPKHTTRTGKTFGGKPFERRQVQKVLTNRAYLGELEWGGVSVDGVHEPLIDADQFDRVQRVLERARAAYSNPQDHGERFAVLKGLVKCGRCGAAMTPYSSTGRGGVRHHYYACTGRIHGTKDVCDQPYIPAQAFEDAIVARCVELARSDNARDRIIGVAVKQAGAEIHRLDDEAAVVKKRLTEIAKEEANLVSVLRAMGETGLQSVESDLRRLQAEKRELGKELEQIAERKGQFKGLGEAGELYLRAWEGLGDLLERATPEEQCKLIQHVVETIVWNPCEENPRKGSYTIRFFPDVVDDRPDLLVEQWPGKNNGSEGSDPLLSPVRKLGWKAPCSQPTANQNSRAS